MDDLFKGYGVEILLENEEAFLKIRETLTRIGVASRKERKLYPSCYILHKRGYYRIVHFKELFALDGRPTNLSENDLARRNSIALLLQDWELLKLSNENLVRENTVDLGQIKILTHREKGDWEISHKYSIGSRKNNTI